MKNQKTRNTLAAALGAVTLALAAMAAFTTLRNAQAAPPKPAAALDAPTLSCGALKGEEMLTLTVTAGASGAPAGFSVQWMPKAEYDLNGWYDSSDPLLCKASFSGVPKPGTLWSLGSGESVTIPIGSYGALLIDPATQQVDPTTGFSVSCDRPLVCGTEYVFRAFAHNVPQGANKSPFSQTVTCSTAACAQEACCMLSQGYWKNHCPVEGFETLTLCDGLVLDVCAELNKNYGGPGIENRRGQLGHQIIAVSLNLGACGNPANDPVQELLDEAIDAYCHSTSQSVIAGYNADLSAYIAENHCPEE